MDQFSVGGTRNQERETTNTMKWTKSRKSHSVWFLLLLMLLFRCRASCRGLSVGVHAIPLSNRFFFLFILTTQSYIRSNERKKGHRIQEKRKIHQNRVKKVVGIFRFTYDCGLMIFEISSAFRLQPFRVRPHAFQEMWSSTESALKIALSNLWRISKRLIFYSERTVLCLFQQWKRIQTEFYRSHRIRMNRLSYIYIFAALFMTLEYCRHSFPCCLSLFLPHYYSLIHIFYLLICRRPYGWL